MHNMYFYKLGFLQQSAFSVTTFKSYEIYVLYLQYTNVANGQT